MLHKLLFVMQTKHCWERTSSVWISWKGWIEQLWSELCYLGLLVERTSILALARRELWSRLYL